MFFFVHINTIIVIFCCVGYWQFALANDLQIPPKNLFQFLKVLYRFNLLVRQTLTPPDDLKRSHAHALAKTAARNKQAPNHGSTFSFSLSHSGILWYRPFFDLSRGVHPYVHRLLVSKQIAPLCDKVVAMLTQSASGVILESDIKEFCSLHFSSSVNARFCSERTSGKLFRRLRKDLEKDVGLTRVLVWCRDTNKYELCLALKSRMPIATPKTGPESSPKISVATSSAKIRPVNDEDEDEYEDEDDEDEEDENNLRKFNPQNPIFLTDLGSDFRQPSNNDVHESDRLCSSSFPSAVKTQQLIDVEDDEEPRTEGDGFGAEEAESSFEGYKLMLTSGIPLKRIAYMFISTSELRGVTSTELSVHIGMTCKRVGKLLQNLEAENLIIKKAQRDGKLFLYRYFDVKYANQITPPVPVSPSFSSSSSIRHPNQRLSVSSRSQSVSRQVSPVPPSVTDSAIFGQEENGDPNAVSSEFTDGDFLAAIGSVTTTPVMEGESDCPTVSSSLLPSAAWFMPSDKRSGRHKVATEQFELRKRQILEWVAEQKYCMIPYLAKRYAHVEGTPNGPDRKTIWRIVNAITDEWFKVGTTRIGCPTGQVLTFFYDGRHFSSEEEAADVVRDELDDRRRKNCRDAMKKAKCAISELKKTLTSRQKLSLKNGSQNSPFGLSKGGASGEDPSTPVCLTDNHEEDELANLQSLESTIDKYSKSSNPVSRFTQDVLNHKFLSGVEVESQLKLRTVRSVFAQKTLASYGFLFPVMLRMKCLHSFLVETANDLWDKYWKIDSTLSFDEKTKRENLRATLSQHGVEFDDERNMKFNILFILNRMPLSLFLRVVSTLR